MTVKIMKPLTKILSSGTLLKYANTKLNDLPVEIKQLILEARTQEKQIIELRSLTRKLCD